jgi:hypothetical protein
MFVQPMWSDEVERIGFRRCTPNGYVLYGIGGVLGFVGLLSMLAALVYLAYRGIAGSFEASLLWLALGPASLGIAGRLLSALAWRLAKRKSYRYDYEKRVSRWMERGEQREFTFEQWRREQAQPETP